jgi:hypothetical protein
MNFEKIYMALLHYPVYNKDGEVVASAITNHDLHDLARLCASFGLAGYFVVNPLPLQRKLAERLIQHWLTGPGAEYNWTRKEAFKRVRVIGELAEVKRIVEEETGGIPKLVATTARKLDGQISFVEMRKIMDRAEDDSWLILFGTGWGLTKEFLEQDVDYVLEPIMGRGDYNHLSVRTAAGIIVDRLLAVDRNKD